MIDVLWLLVCSGLVFLMQPGFMCLESGLTRSKNSINVAVKNFADFGISVALFWAFGYAFMFGSIQNGWIDSSTFFFNVESSPKLAAFFLFQTMFCSTATTIVSGAVAERMKFGGYLVVAALTSGLTYPLFGHWAWNGIETGHFTGWLGQLGFVDFAGATVVHSIGGWVSLAVLLIVGPRIGRFPPNEPPRRIRGGNLQLSVLGAMLLWLGWLGFNGGCTLHLNERVAGILVNTVLAGVAGMLTAVVMGCLIRKRPEVELLINGSLAGLVAITASSDAVATPIAPLIGGVGAGVMILVVYGLERWHIDDAVDAIAVHTGAGVWGTLAVALFGESEVLNTGLSRLQQFFVQLLGISVAFLWAFGLTWIVLNIINRFFSLRVTAEEEDMGLNVTEHGAKTELYELFQVMEHQAKNQDFSLRVPEDPFTEVGQIGLRYNQVMEALEDAITHTEAIIKSTTDAIITFAKPSLEILTVNPSAEAIFGYSQSEFGKKSMIDLFEWPTNNSSEQVILLEKWLQQGEHQVLGRQANGACLTLEATITEAKLGQSSFYTGTFRDISQHKKAEEARRQAEERLQTALDLQRKNHLLEQALHDLKQTQIKLIQSEKMSSLGQLVAGIAHEINNPVNFVYGNLIHATNYTKDLLRLLELYQENFPEPHPHIQQEIDDIDLEFMKEDFPKIVASMRVGADRIREIVQSLRTFSRHDEAEIKRVNLHEGLDSTLMILKNKIKPQGKYSKIEIIKDYGDLPLIECYAGPLNQVFMNLLSNGIDALHEAMEKGYFSRSLDSSEERYPMIEIKTEVIGQNWIRIQIADNGLGIKLENQTKLFDPFFTTKPVGKGTGLGLSISYQIIVERHKGRIDCISELGKGAAFIIEIPIKPPTRSEGFNGTHYSFCSDSNRKDYPAIPPLLELNLREQNDGVTTPNSSGG